jgi:hypothetical protein
MTYLSILTKGPCARMPHAISSEWGTTLEQTIVRSAGGGRPEI